MSVKLKAKDQFWHGFNEAIALVKDYLEITTDISIHQYAKMMDDINLEIEKYKNE